MAKHAGKDVLILVNTGTTGSPTWTSIAGQRGTTLNRKGDAIDTSDKTTSGWKTSLQGLKEWSCEAEIIIETLDNGRQALETAFNAGTNVDICLQLNESVIYRGTAAVTEFTIDTPHDDVMSGKITLSGASALTATSF